MKSDLIWPDFLFSLENSFDSDCLSHAGSRVKILVYAHLLCVCVPNLAAIKRLWSGVHITFFGLILREHLEMLLGTHTLRGTLILQPFQRWYWKALPSTVSVICTPDYGYANSYYLVGESFIVKNNKNNKIFAGADLEMHLYRSWHDDYKGWQHQSMHPCIDFVDLWHRLHICVHEYAKWFHCHKV